MEPASGRPAAVVKRLRFGPDRRVRVSYTWEPSLGSPDDRFATELSLSAPLTVRAEPEAEVWRFPIETVAQS